MHNKTNPEHYSRLNPEPITVIQSWNLSFELGNALKYIARCGNKPSESALDDLNKAVQYIHFEMAKIVKNKVNE